MKKNYDNISRNELLDQFKKMFPNYADDVISCKRLGSRAIAIKFKNDQNNGNDSVKSRVFLYINENNWSFGTKLWRKRPDAITEKLNSKETKVCGFVVTGEVD